MELHGRFLPFALLETYTLTLAYTAPEDEKWNKHESI
jgi:hypothetical protein